MERLTRDDFYDVIVIGAGPAGLSAAINAESERLNTLVVDAADEPGGQAGRSSLIKNYAGAPEVSGRELTARMMSQALSFNTEFLLPWRASRIEVTDQGLAVSDDEHNTFLGHTVLVSTGVEFRRLLVPNLAAYLGRGVSYGSPDVDKTYENKRMYVVGGANSAGQAAMHLSSFTDCDVHLLIRGDDIEDKMSGYLIDDIKAKPNINVHTSTEVVSVDGDGYLRSLRLKTPGGEEDVPADGLFVMIGSDPKTMWLGSVVSRDATGFIKAGADLCADERAAFMEQSGGRAPLTHETTTPGLFVAGDVRCGTTKRVASSAGDGATVVPDLHRYLASLKS